MLQFYFLSVLLNLLTGLILFYSEDISESLSVTEDDKNDENYVNSENDEFSDIEVDGSSDLKKSKKKIISTLVMSIIGVLVMLGK